MSFTLILLIGGGWILSVLSPISCIQNGWICFVIHFMHSERLDVCFVTHFMHSERLDVCFVTHFTHSERLDVCFVTHVITQTNHDN